MKTLAFFVGRHGFGRADWKVEHRARYAQGNAEKVENKHIEKPIFRHNVAV